MSDVDAIGKTSENSVSGDNIFLVSGFIDTVTNMSNNITIAEDASQALANTVANVEGFSLISIVSLSEMEDAVKEVRNTITEGGFSIT
jgi:uncharacterized protein YdeI (YjbR/CyaY-like superfamily)